jgi:hypothetical protein
MGIRFGIVPDALPTNLAAPRTSSSCTFAVHISGIIGASAGVRLLTRLLPLNFLRLFGLAANRAISVGPNPIITSLAHTIAHVRGLISKRLPIYAAITSRQIRHTDKDKCEANNNSAEASHNSSSYA